MLMKKPQNESIFKKKGFLAALYACVGVVMVLAAVVSYRNLAGTGQPDQSSAGTISQSQLQQANISGDFGYQAPDDQQARRTAAPAQTAAPYQAPAVTVKPVQPTQAPSPAQMPKMSAAPKAAATQAPQAPRAPQATQAPAPAAKATAKPVAGVQEDNNPAAAQASEEPAFKKFTGDASMLWPVVGEIVMDYSPNALVYDKTLDQYRTNDSLSIAAPAGTPVKAATAGVVVKVEKTPVEGNTIVIDDGNGWITTYCQLLDGMLVQEGDVVQAGEVIGGVGDPSIYSVLMGNHLEFMVTKDDAAVDPKTLFAQN